MTPDPALLIWAAVSMFVGTVIIFIAFQFPW
jgi:hypothetical protein